MAEIKNKVDRNKFGQDIERNPAQIGEEGKAQPLKEFDEKAPKAEKAKATPAVDPDADEPGLGIAERAARAKRRKAKTSGQGEFLKGNTYSA